MEEVKMTDEAKSILHLEEETAHEVAKGMANLAWLRFNAFTSTVDQMKEKYHRGKTIFESDSDTWVGDLGQLRHTLELSFQEFNRVEYLKNVSKAARNKLDAEKKRKLEPVEEKGEEVKKEEEEKGDHEMTADVV